MKKVSLIFAVLFACSFAMAQTNNSSSVDQSGKNQEAVVDQVGQNSNASAIVQSNEKNKAFVSQVNSPEESGNSTNSYINQSGKRNLATVTQDNNRTNTSSNIANYLLNAVIDQSGNDNVATQIQGPHSQMGATNAYITQSGNSNQAFQIQVRYGNTATIVQSGNSNKAAQAQDTKIPDDVFGSNNTASIFQSGNSNLAEQEQNGWANNAFIDQSGNGNTAVGYNAGQQYGTNTNNTFIGNGTDASVTGLENSTALGNGATVTASNQVRLGNSSVTSLFCHGAYAGISSSGALSLNVRWDGEIGYIVSSRRYKNNIMEIDNPDWLFKLRPVSFNYNEDESGTRHIGLIAEEVEEVNPNLVVYKDGVVETVNYNDLIVPMLKTIQEQKVTIDTLRDEYNGKISELQNQINELKHLIEKVNKSF